MCGRITLAVDSPQQLALQLGARLDPADEHLYRPRYNVAPTQVHWLVREEAGERRLVPARWSYASGHGRLLINARSESAAEKVSFREAFQRRRCVIPADGFYEWKGPAKDRRPLWFHRADGALLLLAGLWQPPAPGEKEARFTILTTQANERVAPVHDRMPVILPPEQMETWLRQPASGLLVPLPPDELQAREVSQRVNSTANDDPSCLDPPASRKGRQLGLFE